MSPGRALTISLLLHFAAVLAPLRPPAPATSPPGHAAATAALRASWHTVTPVPTRERGTAPADAAAAALSSASEPAAPPPAPSLAPPAPLSPRYYRSAEVDQRAEPIDPPPIVLPEVAYVAGIRGTVRLRLYIGSLGTVDSVDILAADPPGVFENAVLEAVTATRFEPARLFGRAVGNVKEIEIRLDPYETIAQP